MQIDQRTAVSQALEQAPILICLFGGFRLLKDGQCVAIRNGGKTESLLYNLALRHGHPVPRDNLLCLLWPDVDAGLAGQALHSLVHSLHKQLGQAIQGAAPVVFQDGRYKLNTTAGVQTDLTQFESLASAGDRNVRAGDWSAATACYEVAVSLYRGDLDGAADIYAVVQRERLRARYLGMLARLADHHFTLEDYATCLHYAIALLECDPCREDAHRLAMRCYVRRGERAQAFRQYRTCEQALRSEYGAVPETATSELFDRLRLHPNSL
ncbi:MAG: bacterial transcriptional activator domain-containing protein [Chloroflexota bacterium]|nr:bacterial transcriptional activator domain-containing protein [Chloroflexota bacterium]